jgi:hypothetical protein
MNKRVVLEKLAHRGWKIFCLVAVLVPTVFGTTFDKYGCTVQEIQTQPGINIGGTPHNIATVNLIQGSNTYICWFILDDAAGYGKILFSLMMAAQAANKKVDVEYSDVAPVPAIYTQDNPTTSATLNLWSASTH